MYVLLSLSGIKSMLILKVPFERFVVGLIALWWESDMQILDVDMIYISTMSSLPTFICD